MTKIPQYGDPELLPKGTVRSPSAERQPFDNAGALKPAGPGPRTEERFYSAPDLAHLPQWRRRRGDEWTTREFRQLVLSWLQLYCASRAHVSRWEVREIGSAPRSGRLPEEQCHLVICIAAKNGARFETAVAFPRAVREGAAASAVLSQAALALDTAYSASPAP